MKDSPAPLVSIGLPVYNGERHIAHTIEDLLKQDYAQIELIISDNASTDRTGEICRAYAANDPRVRYYRNSTNLGAIKNFNRVFELSRGAYFMWAADHDIHAPTFVSRCVEVLEREPEVVLCYPETARLEADDYTAETITPRLDTRGMYDVQRFQAVIWSLTYCYQVYGLLRSSVLRRTSLMRTTVGPDTILLAELSLLGTFAFVPERLFFIRRMPDAGDWGQYVRKLGRRLTRVSALKLCGEMVWYHLLVVRRHMPSRSRRALLMLSVLLCIPIRYRAVFGAIIAASKR